MDLMCSIVTIMMINSLSPNYRPDPSHSLRYGTISYGKSSKKSFHDSLPDDQGQCSQLAPLGPAYGLTKPPVDPPPAVEGDEFSLTHSAIPTWGPDAVHYGGERDRVSGSTPVLLNNHSPNKWFARTRPVNGPSSGMKELSTRCLTLSGMTGPWCPIPKEGIAR